MDNPSGVLIFVRVFITLHVFILNRLIYETKLDSGHS